MQAEVQGTGVPAHTVGIERLTHGLIRQALIPNATPGTLAVVERNGTHVKVCATEGDVRQTPLLWQRMGVTTVEGMLTHAGRALARSYGARWTGMQPITWMGVRA